MIYSHFSFIDYFDSTLRRDGFFIDIPAGISSKDALLSVYSKSAQFPDYFGFNWDSLRDCLSDFSWIDSPLIVISHADLPLFGDVELLKVYLGVLDDSAASFELARDSLSTADHVKARQTRLLVGFPVAQRETIEAI